MLKFWVIQKDNLTKKYIELLKTFKDSVLNEIKIRS